MGSDKGLIVIEHKKSGGAFIILGNSSELKNKGHVICLDIGYHNKMLVAGYSSGILAFFNLKKGKLAKKIEGIFKNKRIKIVKFLKSHDPKKKDFTIVAMDEDGILMRIFIQKTNNFGRKILKKQCSMIIYDKFKGNLLQIEPLFIDFEDNKQKKNCFVACATTSRCYILNLENNICQFEIEKPSYINNKAIPMLSVDQTDFQSKFLNDH